MYSKYLPSLCLLFSFTPALAAPPDSAADTPTRQVVQGDLVYRAKATAADESWAVFYAEARAARMLAIECGAPPRETRIYLQNTRHIAGAFTAEVEEGAPIADCEALRRTPPYARDALAQPELARSVALYESLFTGSGAKRAPAATAAPAPRLPVLWSDDQELSHRLALQARADRRLRERELITKRR